MAILPPTSPTTVIGGFSLAIITAKESRGGYLCTPANNGQRRLIPRQIGQSRLGKMGWKELFFWFGELQRSNSIVHKRCKCSKTAKNQWLQLLPHCTLPTPTGFNQSDKLSSAHAMHEDTVFLPSIPNQKVKSCCLDSQPQPQAQAQAQAGPQQQSADEYASESLVSHRTTAADKHSWRLLHTHLQMYWGQSSVQQHCWYYFYMHTPAGTAPTPLSRRCNSCILSTMQNIFCFFHLIEAVSAELWKD